MKTVLAWIGGIVVLLWFLGVLDVGTFVLRFHLHYDPLW